MADQQLPDHARLSASGAERWMECSASISLAERFGLTGEESVYAAEGTAAHELAAECLEQGTDAWEYIGQEFYKHKVDADMSVYVQMYLDYIRETYADVRGVEIVVETRIDDPGIHKDHGGAVDCYVIGPAFVHVYDFKYGAGIAVDIGGNPQLRYYAHGVLYKLRKEGRLNGILHVGTTIVQPRSFHRDGPIREKWYDVEEIFQWFDWETLPAMDRVDNEDPRIKCGEWCRFCPAKLVCPVMKSMFQAAFEADPADAKMMTNDELGLDAECAGPVKMFIKAIEEESFKRMMRGESIPGRKLIDKRADRVWKPGAEKAMVKEFGEKKYTPRKLMSPAQVEKLPMGKSFAAKWGYKPKTGQTLAPIKDSAPEVKVKKATDVYKTVKGKS